MLLPIAETSSEAAHQWRLQWSWPLPTWATVMLALGITCWIIALYARESAPLTGIRRLGLTLLRLAALLLAALMIAAPTVQWFRQGRAPIVLLVDRSASMTIDDLDTDIGWQTRLQWAQRQAAEWLSQWQELNTTQLVCFAGHERTLEDDHAVALDVLQQLQPATVEQGTSLGDAVDFALQSTGAHVPATVVVLTDGVNTQGKSMEQVNTKASALQVPIYSVAVGSERPQPDFALENLVAEQVVFPGDFLQVEVSLLAKSLAGERAEVSLTNPLTGEQLATSLVQINADSYQRTVRLGFRAPEPGEMKLQLMVSRHENERYQDNNSLEHSIRVSSQKIRVLLVQSSPSYEYRALASLLERDPAVQLRTWLQEADPGYAEVDRAALPSFPATSSELREYDVIILGDVNPAPVPKLFWENLQSFVSSEGGGLVCIAGPRFMPNAFRNNESLATLLPLELKKQSATKSDTDPLATYSIRPTSVGTRLAVVQLADTPDESQATWQRLPPVTWLVAIGRLKPGAQVLVAAANPGSDPDLGRPAVVRHYVGAGEVFFHATDETWRWKWRSDDRYFVRYWGQVVRRLGRGRVAAGRQGVLLTSDRKSYLPGQRVNLQVQFRNPAGAPADGEGVTVELVGETRPLRQLQVSRRLGYRGTFQRTISDLPPDQYSAKIVSPELARSESQADFEVKSSPGELARTTVDGESLATMARRTGGKSYTVETADQLTADLPAARTETVESISDQPLWNSHWTIGALLAALTAEWILRRRWGML